MTAAALEYKTLPTGPDGTDALTGVIDHDDEHGTITAIVAVSGVRDEVGDFIVPGSLGKAIKRLKPKGVNNHDWGVKVSKMIYADELMPGDPRLPPRTAQGDPWPREAGGLLVKAKYNLEKKEGRDAYADAIFYEDEESFSIGYKVRTGGAKKRGDTRYLHDYDIYEWSQVLHGANTLARLTGVKSLLDTVTPPGTWYDEDRSGTGSEGQHMEFKVRYVRDPEFWGLPLGTILRAGMKPRGERARAIRAQGRIPDPSEGTDTVAPGQDALLPEEGARRVKPRARGEWDEASDDPAADLVYALQGDDRRGEGGTVESILAEVLDDALTPSELEDELRDAAEGADIAEDDLRDTLDDYRRMYWDRLEEQTRTGRAGVDPGTRQRALDAAGEAIDDAHKERLVIALTALEDDNPKATAAWILGGEYGRSARHKRFEIASEALKDGAAPRADDELTDTQLREIASALANDRDDEFEGSHEYDVLNDQFQAAYDLLAARDKGEPDPATPLPEPGWGDPYVKTPAYQTPDGPVWLFRKGTRARFYDRTGRQVGPEQANVGPAVAYAHGQSWVTEWGKAPAKAKLPKVTPGQVSAAGERARSPRARKLFLADAALDDLEMEKRALFAAREEIPLSPTSGLPLTPGERGHRSKLKAYEEQIDKAIQRAKGDVKPPAKPKTEKPAPQRNAAEAAQRRQVMVTRLRDAGDGQNAVLTALRGVDTSGHPQMATALQVTMSTLTHPSAKSVTAQANELVKLSRGDADAPGDDELLTIADQIDAVAAALDTAGSGTRVPLRSVKPSERPRLADYLRDYTAALRTRLGEQDTEAPEQEKPAAKPKAGRKPKKLSEQLTAAVDRYNARAGEGRSGAVPVAAKPPAAETAPRGERPTHPLSPKEYVVHRERALSRRFRREDIDRRNKEADKERDHIERSRATAASAPAVIEDPPEGTVLVAGGRIALSGAGKTTWKLQTAGGWTLTDARMFGASGAHSAVKLNRTQAGQLAERIAALTDIRGNPVPTTVADREAWARGWRDAEGHDIQHAIHKVAAEWAAENGIAVPEHVRAAVDRPPRGEPRTAGVPDAEGFRPHETPRDVNPGDEVRLPDGSVHTVSGRRGPGKEGRVVLEFDDGTEHDFGSFGRVDTRYADDPDDTRDPGMGFEVHPNMGAAIGRFQPNVRESIERDNPDPVPAGTRSIYTLQRSALHGDYDDRRPRVGTVTDRYATVAGDWFQVIDYDDGTADAIRTRNLVKSGALVLDPVPEQIDAALREWGPDSERSRTGTPAKPEINLSRLGGLDDTALSTALDDARRKHRMLVENGVPRNSTALHDAKRAVTMLEDEQRRRQEKPADPAAGKSLGERIASFYAVRRSAEAVVTSVKQDSKNDIPEGIELYRVAFSKGSGKFVTWVALSHNQFAASGQKRNRVIHDVEWMKRKAPHQLAPREKLDPKLPADIRADMEAGPAVPEPDRRVSSEAGWQGAPPAPARPTHPAAATGPDRQTRAGRALERARTDIGAIKLGDDDLTRADIDAKRGEIEQAQYDMVEALRHNAVSNWSTPSSSRQGSLVPHPITTLGTLAPRPGKRRAPDREQRIEQAIATLKPPERPIRSGSLAAHGYENDVDSLAAYAQVIREKLNDGSRESRVYRDARMGDVADDLNRVAEALSQRSGVTILPREQETKPAPAKPAILGPMSHRDRIGAGAPQLRKALSNAAINGASRITPEQRQAIATTIGYIDQPPAPGDAPSAPFLPDGMDPSALAGELDTLADNLDEIGHQRTAVDKRYRDREQYISGDLRKVAAALREPKPDTTEPPPPASDARQARLDADDAIADQDREALADALTRLGVGAGGDDWDPYDVAAGLLAIPTDVQAQRLDRLEQAATMVAEPEPIRYAEPTAEELAMQDDVPEDSPLTQVIAEEAARREARLAAWNQSAPADAVITPAAQADAVITPAAQADAEVLRGDTLGLTEAEDGELEVTEEVAQRQDRVTALLESGADDLGGRTDDELGGTRRDLVDELALQEELRRRDVARRQEAAARRTSEVTEPAPPADDATEPAEPAKPRARPGLTGALDDLADALNEHGVTAADHETVRAATDRLTTVLRRNRSDSEVVTELRALLGDDPGEAIRAGRVRPGVLLGLSERMRQEARDRRNAAARARRLARRIERDRIRSMIGQVDGELRRRGRNPEEYGGAVVGVQAQSEPDMGDLAQHQRPADLVAEDQAIRDRTARAIELIREARKASEGGDHARAVDLMEQAQAADPSRADRMTEMRNRFAALRDKAAPGDMTDEQLRATDARMDEERRASGARSITDEHRTIKAELGRRSSVAARSASAKRGAETRARRQAAGLPPKREPFTPNKPPPGGWTDADLTEQGLTRALDEARREYRQAHDAGAPNTEAAKARHDALLAERRRRSGEAPEALEPAIRLEDLRDGTLNQLKVTVDRGRFAMAVDGRVRVGTIVRRSGGSATFTPDDGDPIELTVRHRIRGALLTADDKISPQYAFAERMAAGFRPARYTEVNADTGETTERPDLARPAEETRLIDLAREFRAALERGDLTAAQERIDSAREADPGNPRWDNFQTELDTRRASVEPPAPELTAGEQATERSRAARQAFDDGEPDRALELVEQARALDPGRHRLWDKIRRHIENNRPTTTAPERNDDGPPATPNRDAVPPAPPEPEDQELGRVLPPPDERGDDRGPGSGGRTAGGRPAGGRDAGPRDARTGGGARPERPARGAGTTTTEPRGSGDRRGAGGVREREAGTAEPDQPGSGLSEADQPTPDSETVDAIPDAGPRFRPDGVDDFAPPGERAKLNANMAALRTLRRLQDDPDRPATPEEQATLARWAGWGGLPDVFEERASKAGKYASERAELQELLSPAEYRAAERNTLNAHYTDARVASAMWDAVQALGFDGGRGLEPGSGSGNFIGFAPEEVQMTGVEVDPITAAISKYLYPDADIRNESFGKTNIPEGTFDLTIGNVPFGDFPVADRRYNPGNKSNIHNHFIRKSLAQTKPGGLVAVLTSRHTLDSRNDRERRRFAEMADLVGAVRLPTGSHQRASGTSVIEDILIFRRREPGAEPRGDQSWVNSTKRDLDGFELQVSDYWAAHPGHVLGEMRGEAGRYGGDIVVKGDRDMPDLPGVLAGIVETAHADGLTATPHDPGRETYEIASSEHHEGRIGLDADGNWTQVSGGAEYPLDVPEAQREELRALAGLRDTRRALLAAEAATGEDTPALRDLRADLNERYDTYVERYGPINRFTRTRNGSRRQPPVMPLWRRDPMSSLVRALETYDADSGKAVKAAVFRKRIAAPRVVPDTADTPVDALALSLDTWGEVRLPEIARWLDTDEAGARDQLGELVFEQPPLSDVENEAAWRRELETSHLPEARFGRMPFDQGSADGVDLLDVGESVRQEGRLEPAAAYLSGNVRRKLAAARAAAEHDSRFKLNVEALERIVPTDLTPQEIEGRLGAAWITAEDVTDFLADLLEVSDRERVKVSTSGGGLWNVSAPDWNTLATETWGTNDRSASELVQALLEQRPIKVTRSVEGPDGKKRSVPDLDATLAAQEKAEAIAERFSEWLWEDPDRSARLQARYNNQFNAIVLREYEGERTFPGMAAEYAPRPHQVAAVNRAVAEPAALFAHIVGAGKTGEMVMTAAEWKRLGLVKKPAIVVPNHMLEQFEREYLEIYPNAKILAAGTDDLTGDKRREFVARAASNDYDAVILTQGAFEAIPVGRERMQAYIDRELADMRRQMKEAEDSFTAQEKTGNSPGAKTIKRMQAALAKAEAALEAKLDKAKDDGVTWEETKIDGLLMDEAHHYSNLRTLSNIPGAGATGSDKATDLHMKIEDLRANNPTARVVFATGTPIRNTITQAYIMQRFLRPDLLKQAGIHSFDQWAATFGKIVEEMELKPEGTGFRQSTRFAKFQNVPELLQMFRIFADVKMAEDLDLPTPDLAGGKIETVTVGRTDQTAAFIRDLGRRAELIRDGKPEKRIGANGETVEDNMLLVSMDGRKAALSMRLVGGHHESGKIEMAADRIYAKWEATKNNSYPLDPGYPDMGDDPTPGALQLAFLDRGTPGDPNQWSAYSELKTQLVARGMDPKSIRFIHEARNDTERAELFAAARAGRISVLVGSTEKMGTGVNIQRRAVAMHHLDAPWRPSDVEQRDGRIMRQGNLNPEVEIIRYVTEGSFDAYMWQTLERKAKFINQVMHGTLNTREAEDVGDAALSYAEVKALATGNPDLMDLAKVDTLRSKLERLARTHERTQANLRHKTGLFHRTIAESETKAEQLATAITQHVDTRGEKFLATIGTERYAKRADANRDLNARLWDVLNGFSRNRVKVGAIGGFDLYAEPVRERSGGWGVAVDLDGIPDEVVTYGLKDLRDGKVDTISRIEYALGALESRRTWILSGNDNLRTEIEHMAPRIGLTFNRADELDAAKRKSDRLRQKMLLDAQRIDGKDIPFDPQVDSARFDSPLVGGGTAADAPPDPGGLIEQAEWERAWELRRAQAAAERADAPTPMETALAKVRAALEPGAAHVAGGRNTLQRFAEIASENPDAIHASPSGRIIATRRKDGGWVAYDAITGFNLSAPTWSYLDFRGDVDAALAELEELKIPWGDAPLQEAKRKARGSS
ncbi:MAG: helicase-related protein, partial [Pseudonocardiaceae bacterium]